MIPSQNQDVIADSEAPMLVDLGFNDIWSMEHDSMINSQYNATYSMDGAKIVIYDTEYDDYAINKDHTRSFNSRCDEWRSTYSTY